MKLSDKLYSVACAMEQFYIKHQFVILSILSVIAVMAIAGYSEHQEFNRK